MNNLIKFEIYRFGGFSFRNNKGREIIVKPADNSISLEEFESKWPNVLCKCAYSKSEFNGSDGIVLGAVLPQANISYLCHPVDGRAGWIYSTKCFDEIEQNCNKCKFLERIPFRKWEHGLDAQPGICKNPNGKPLYDKGFPNILFYPDDCMLQSCWVGR